MSRRLHEAIGAAAATLAEAGIDSARTDAELLAAHVLGVERGRLSLTAVPDGFRDRYEVAVRRRARRTPLQHITGTAQFGPVRLHVGPGVFIPRPETECLLDWVSGQQIGQHPVIVDVCTGSGALALALAAWRPGARVIAIDDDAQALSYARRNTEGTAVELVAADVTDAVLCTDLDGSVDLVVANPPYIPAGAETEVQLQAHLEAEVAQHDPHHALFGGADGMAVIAPLVGHAVRWLRPGGLLAVEHDDTTSAATVDTLAATGAFDAITAHSDLAGRPRFVTAQRRAPR